MNSIFSIFILIKLYSKLTFHKTIAVSCYIEDRAIEGEHSFLTIVIESPRPRTRQCSHVTAPPEEQTRTSIKADSQQTTGINSF